MNKTGRDRYQIRPFRTVGDDVIPCGLSEARAFDILLDGGVVAYGIKPDCYLANQIIDLHITGQLTPEYLDRALAP